MKYIVLIVIDYWSGLCGEIVCCQWFSGWCLSCVCWLLVMELMLKIWNMSSSCLMLTMLPWYAVLSCSPSASAVLNVTHWLFLS